MSRLSACLAGLALVACGTLPAPSLVARTRVVGAHVEIAGDPGRAWPLPGESASITYYVIRRDPTELVSASFTVCPAGPAIGGIRLCAGAPIAVASRPPAVEPLAFEVVIPSAEVLGDAQELVALLATCAGGGDPIIDATMQTARCSGETPGRAEISTFALTLADPEHVETANHHPDLSDTVVTVEMSDGPTFTWDTAIGPVPEEGCASVAGTSAFPRLTTEMSDAGVLTFAWTSSAADRETYVEVHPINGPETVRESLEFSHFATLGSFERNTSRLDGTSTDDRVARVGWTTPSPMDIPPDGATLHVWWVARDGRGGFGLVQRDACVVLGE